LALSLTASLAATPGAWAQGVPAELQAYLDRPEPTFACQQAGNDTTPAGKVYSFRFQSQEWRGIPWTHQLRVYEPAGLDVGKSPVMLLFITGGRVGGEVKPSDHAQGFALARACNARVAVLPQVPNQPLLGDRYEDDLIGETFVKFLETREADWPLLLPMVKSAVKAMDGLEAWARGRGEVIDGFVVAGASKRGWTTWLVGAHDPRVKAIAPMVIPTLNMRAQSKHQLDSWGKYSEQIEDYTRRGLTEKFDDPVGRLLWQMVDPYSYLDRVKVPVLQINGTNDRYWTVDSVNLFWDDIQAPWKGVVSLPNAGHGLDQNRDWAIQGIGTLVRHVAAGVPMPTIEPRVVEGAVGPSGIAVEAVYPTDQPRPRATRLWSALSNSRDFRDAQWVSMEMVYGLEGSVVSGPVKVQPGRFTAAFLELEYEFQGEPFHLTTPIRVFGDGGEIRPAVTAEAEAKP
jgi:PhoPQ-activated pathogenicity-related protein